MYARANELLSEPRTTHAAAMELREIKAELAKLDLSHADVAKPAADRTYVPYPWYDDVNFNRRIHDKREFYEHRSKPVPKGSTVEALWDDSCNMKTFELTPVQLIIRNFMSPRTPYSSLLLFHQTGVGKTCTAVTVAESFDEMKNRVLVITSPGLATGFRRNIYDVDRVPLREDGSYDFETVTQCTGLKYSDRIRDRHLLTKEQLEARVAGMIRAKYDIMGPGKFAHIVARMLPHSGAPSEAAVEAVRKMFGNRVIIVDEAHHLRGDDKKRVTPALKRVLSLVDNVKLVLMTATPMFNRAADIMDLLNLLRANDKLKPLRVQDLFDRLGRLKPGGDAILRDACRGYISYMRGENPFSFPLRLGPTANADKAVLGSKDVPVVDIKGHPIDRADRLRELEIVGSVMGPVQYAAYRETESDIIEYLQAKSTMSRGRRDMTSGAGRNAEVDLEDGEDEEGDEDDEGEDGDRGTNKSAISMGQAMCNVVYPVPSGPPCGKAAFDACFVRVSAAKQLQVSYKAQTPPFLEPASIGRYAAKLGTIVRKILSSEGVVMVYSRFVWSGLVPLAIALEHVGLTRFDGTPLLKGATAAASVKNWRYAIISGTREVASDQAKAEVALRSSENADGSVVKVVLVSDKGSEGLDLKYVREVHIAEPWYHMNKIEQIVGRAARHCSHKSLPLEKRNVTVYLHACLEPGRRKETVDLRAYRIAEQKQIHIRRVEAILRSSAFDCNLNREKLYFDRQRLNLATAVVTSQGSTIKGYKIGDDPGSAISCSPLIKGDTAVDSSTYDPKMHEHHGHVYTRLLRDLFSDQQPKKTFADIWAHVQGRFKHASIEMLAATLDDMVAGERPVLNARGIEGFLVYRGGFYLFQPAAAETRLLEERERSVAHAGPRRLLLSVRSQGQDGAEPLVYDADSMDAQLRKRVTDLIEESNLRALAVDPAAKAKLEAAALDAVVDRLQHRELMAVGAAALSAAAQGTPTDLERSILDSLARGRVLVRSKNGITALRSMSDAKLYCFDPAARHLRMCMAEEVAALGEQPAARRDQAAQLSLAGMQPDGKGSWVLRIGDMVQNQKAKPARGAACASSGITADGFRNLIGAALHLSTARVGAAMTKARLCTLYELVLRAFKSNLFARPGF
jgi:hypothetical protein